jgi:hypothetical protein
MSSFHFFAGPALVAKAMHVTHIRRPGKGRHKKTWGALAHRPALSFSKKNVVVNGLK